MKKSGILQNSNLSISDEKRTKIEPYTIPLFLCVGITFIFIIWDMIHGLYRVEFLAIAGAAITGEIIYKYTQSKKIYYLFLSILVAICTIIMAIVFFIGV